MCKTFSINYSCAHTRQVRLSKCRGTFTTKSKPTSEPKALCCSAPVFSIQANAACGQCKRGKDETKLTESLLKIKASLPWSDPELMAAEAKYNTDIFALSKRFPGAKFKTITRPETQQRMELLRGSLLREEVQPEDVVDDAWEEYAKDWSKPYGNFDGENAGDGEVSMTEETATEDEGSDDWSAPTDWTTDTTPTDTVDFEPWDDRSDVWSTPADWTSDTSSVDMDDVEPSDAVTTLLSTVENGAIEGLSSHSIDIGPDTTCEAILNDTSPSNQTTISPAPPGQLKPPTAPYTLPSKSELASRSSSQSTKMELDLLERLQCFRFHYLITVRT